MNRTVSSITARLSLRSPQEESLEILANILESIELSKAPDLIQTLKTIEGMYPSVKDFEREFPSLCFAIATGVGKTRLMGAFIAYFYLTGRSHNFFVLAPNLTIYDKLISDFSPQSPKYVFRGIAEFATNQPVIITGDNYESGIGVRGRDLLGHDDTPYINIFNISKINATENKPGAAKSKVAKIKRLQEYIGESYFEYLSNLPDLVLLMDEAHRYRATAGANAINELKPLLGIELTATPKSVGAKSTDFKNIIYDYPLAQAMIDGYVKDPAVATRKDFNVEQYKNDPERLERIKLEDGIHHHEHVKVELDVYARQYAKPLVKPFMLVVAQDTEHARQLRAVMESNDFFAGRYKGKVAEIHSKQSGTEEDENIQKLIAIENPAEPTEIVIHVNKLKEGWDVTNLYTIVPLRASASEILTEQTIGRGLRLPYGRRTGVEAVDRLTIVAHDQFQKIVDAANNPDSIIRKTVIIGEGGEIGLEKPRAIEVPSIAETALSGFKDRSQDDYAVSAIIKSPEHQHIAAVTIEVARKYERLDSSQKLKEPEIQKKIADEVREILRPVQGALDGILQGPDIEEVVNTVTTNLAELTIDVPNIVLIPTREITYGFKDFDLQNLGTVNYPPVSEEILIHQLRTNQKSTLTWNSNIEREARPENYIVRSLIDHDEIDYDEHADLLYKLAGQIVARLHSYLKDEAEVENVLLYYQKRLSQFVFAQMMEHYWETPTDYRPSITQGFSILKPVNYTLAASEKPRNFRQIPQNKSDVKKMVFSGFTKCCYPLQKFDSVDGELRFANLLEDDATVLKWMKPAPGVFRIEYRDGIPYNPDFVVETTTEKLICEPKMESEMKSDDVLTKARSATKWCRYASEYAKANGKKPWSYLLIPHTAIDSNRSLDSLKAEYQVNELDL